MHSFKEGLINVKHFHTFHKAWARPTPEHPAMKWTAFFHYPPTLDITAFTLRRFWGERFTLT